MAKLQGIDLKRAQLVPSSAFSSPAAVLEQEGLSAAQKSAILRRWEFDARRISGFPASGGSSQQALMLGQIRRALRRLAATQAGRSRGVSDGAGAGDLRIFAPDTRAQGRA